MMGKQMTLTSAIILVVAVLCLACIPADAKSGGGSTSTTTYTPSSSYYYYSYTPSSSYYYSYGYHSYYSSSSGKIGGGVGGAIAFVIIVVVIVVLCRRRRGVYLAPVGMSHPVTVVTPGYTTTTVTGPNYNSGQNIASQQEYRDAKTFQALYPPMRTNPAQNPMGLPFMQIPMGATYAVQTASVCNGSRINFQQVAGVEDRCVQTNALVHGYFEVTIEHLNHGVCLAIGFGSKPYPPFRLPGWESVSMAYHSDNGNTFFNNDADGKRYGPTFGVGDTIGCGYTPNGDFYFTRNGQHLGNAYNTQALLGETYGLIGCDGVCQVSTNFGERPFAFQMAPRPNYGVIFYGGYSPCAPAGYAPQQMQPQQMQPQQQLFQPQAGYAPPGMQPQQTMSSQQGYPAPQYR